MLPPAPGLLSTTNGWPNALLQLGRERARQDVGGAAGGKRHDDAHRARWPGLRARQRRHAEGREGDDGASARRGSSMRESRRVVAPTVRAAHVGQCATRRAPALICGSTRARHARRDNESMTRDAATSRADACREKRWGAGRLARGSLSTTRAGPLPFGRQPCPKPWRAGPVRSGQAVKLERQLRARPRGAQHLQHWPWAAPAGAPA